MMPRKPSCEDIREREGLEKSVYMHGMLPKEYLGKYEDALADMGVEILGKKVEIYDLTQGFGYGVPLWPYFDDVKIERMHYHSRARVLTQVLTHTMHVGTHIDAPVHVEEDYPYIDQIPLSRFIGKGVVVDIPKRKWEVVTPYDLERAEPSIEPGDIVIVHTGWHRFYGDNIKYYIYAPGFYKEAGEWFVKKGVKLVGIDTQAMDHPLGTRIAQPPPLVPWVLEEYRKETGRDLYQDFPYWEPCHRILYTHGILGIENVGGDIDKVLGKRVTIIALPLKWHNGDGSMIRLIAIEEKR
jgi:kynurenine formamidase